jgi:hypothetical protein
MPSTVITVRVCHTRKGFDFGVHMFNHYTFPGKPFIERFLKPWSACDSYLTLLVYGCSGAAFLSPDTQGRRLYE